MSDFVLISAAWFLDQKVSTYDSAGTLVPDDGDYQKQGAEIVFIFAEFLRDKGLLCAGVDVSRRPKLELRFSELTDQGQEFARSALDKWVQSLDRAGMNKPVDSSGLERRWAKFLAG